MKSAREKSWKGAVGALILKHLLLREAMGKVSRADHEVLWQFNQFLGRKYPKLKVPNRVAILHFLSTKSNLSLSGRKSYVIYIRQFCLFLNRRGIPCYIPDKTLLPKIRYQPRYFPLSQEQIRLIMNEARKVRRNRSIVGETYAVVLGLLWCTGMRRREAILLNHSDLDLEQGTLLIRMTKFRKTRMIPIDKSANLALRSYIAFKASQGYPAKPNDPLFIGLEGRRLTGNNLGHTFHRIVTLVGMRSEQGRVPCLHDLRHNFATRALKRLYSEPERFPPNSYLPTLATFLGHVDMRFSQYYLHPDFNLMQQASDRLERRQRKAA